MTLPFIVLMFMVTSLSYLYPVSTYFFSLHPWLCVPPEMEIDEWWKVRDRLGPGPPTGGRFCGILHKVHLDQVRPPFL
jgi:hypothetical protein